MIRSYGAIVLKIGGLVVRLPVLPLFDPELRILVLRVVVIVLFQEGAQTVVPLDGSAPEAHRLTAGRRIGFVGRLEWRRRLLVIQLPAEAKAPTYRSQAPIYRGW